MQVKKIIYDRALSFPEASFFLFGVRGSGKTSLLRQRFPDALYIDLLNEETYQSYLADIKLFSQQINVFADHSLVVVDEIQRMPHLLNEVHRLMELSPQRRFILTGSSARKIRAKGVNLLGGRAGWLNLHPFTPGELGQNFDLESALHTGLLPVVWSASDRPLRSQVLYTTLFERRD